MVLPGTFGNFSLNARTAVTGFWASSAAARSRATKSADAARKPATAKDQRFDSHCFMVVSSCSADGRAGDHDLGGIFDEGLVRVRPICLGGGDQLRAQAALAYEFEH